MAIHTFRAARRRIVLHVQDKAELLCTPSHNIVIFCSKRNPLSPRFAFGCCLFMSAAMAVEGRALLDRLALFFLACRFALIVAKEVVVVVVVVLVAAAYQIYHSFPFRIFGFSSRT